MCVCGCGYLHLSLFFPSASHCEKRHSFLIFSSTMKYLEWSHRCLFFPSQTSTLVSIDWLLILWSCVYLYLEFPLWFCGGLSSLVSRCLSLSLHLFFHTVVPFLRCAVGECCSGRQTDTGRVLWTTFPLTSLSSFLLLLLFLLSCIASLPLLNSNQSEVHERTFICSFHETVL